MIVAAFYACASSQKRDDKEEILSYLAAKGG